jgi:hypothetical protein
MPEPSAPPNAFLEVVREKYRPAMEAAAPAADSTAAPTLTPAEAQRDIRAEIAAIRANPADPWRDEKHPDHAQALLDMEHRYRLLSGEAQGPVPPEAPPQESLSDALNRQAAEASALELRGPTGQEVPGFLNEAAQAQSRNGMDQATREAARETVLRKEWGEHYDVWAQRAWAMVAELPPRLQAYAEQYRMGEDPWMWLRAVELWKRKNR